jgi:hypothetical protein
LSSEDNLTDAGVNDGDQLNIVPKSKSKSGTKKKTVTPSAATSSTSVAETTPAAAGGGMEDLLKGLGGSGGMDDFMKSMGGGEGGAPNMQESMEMM